MQPLKRDLGASGVLRISELLGTQHVVFFESLATHEDVYGRLVRTWEGIDHGAVLKAILEREKISPTLIDDQIALPHARLSKFGPLCAALGLCSKGLADVDGNVLPVRVVLLFAGDLGMPRECLAFLSSAAALFGKDGLKERLVQQTNPQEVVKLLRHAEREENV